MATKIEQMTKSEAYAGLAALEHAYRKALQKTATRAAGLRAGAFFKSRAKYEARIALLNRTCERCSNVMPYTMRNGMCEACVIHGGGKS